MVLAIVHRDAARPREHDGAPAHRQPDPPVRVAPGRGPSPYVRGTHGGALGRPDPARTSAGCTSRAATPTPPGSRSSPRRARSTRRSSPRRATATGPRASASPTCSIPSVTTSSASPCRAVRRTFHWRQDGKACLVTRRPRRPHPCGRGLQRLADRARDDRRRRRVDGRGGRPVTSERSLLLTDFTSTSSLSRRRTGCPPLRPSSRARRPWRATMPTRSRVTSSSRPCARSPATSCSSTSRAPASSPGPTRRPRRCCISSPSARASTRTRTTTSRLTRARRTSRAGRGTRLRGGNRSTAGATSSSSTPCRRRSRGASRCRSRTGCHRAPPGRGGAGHHARRPPERLDRLHHRRRLRPRGHHGRGVVEADSHGVKGCYRTAISPSDDQMALGGTTSNQAFLLDTTTGKATVLLTASVDSSGKGKGLVHGDFLCSPGCGRVCLLADADDGKRHRWSIRRAGARRAGRPRDGPVGRPPASEHRGVLMPGGVHLSLARASGRRRQTARPVMPCAS